MNEDREWLRRYVETGCEESFALLVRRYLNPVYSIALRECLDPHQAEELTQATFLILARKASSLSSGVILSGWLFQTVRYTARNQRRAEMRRREREQEIMAMTPTEVPSKEEEALWSEIAPRLNQALADLGSADRDALLLRFFEQKSHAEIATLLRTNEPAARKRLSRALERLRVALGRLGVALPAAVLTSLLTTQSVQAAPAGLVAGITASGAAAVGGTSSAASTLAIQTMHRLAMTQVQLVVATVVGCLALVGVGAVAVKAIHAGPVDTSTVRYLSDGSTFRLVQVDLTNRMNYRYRAAAPRWESLARKVLPAGWVNRWAPSRGSGSITLQTAPGSFGLFVATAHEDRPSSGGIDLNRIRVRSDDGSVFDGIFNSGTLGFQTETFTAWHIDAFPRRSGYLQFEFLSPTPPPTSKAITTFTITNPVGKTDYPDWKPEPLPQSRIAGDLRVELREVVNLPRLEHPPGDLSPFWKDLPSTRWSFNLSTAPAAADGATASQLPPWKLRSMTISDATGNRWSPMSLQNTPIAGADPRLEVAMAGALWETEPAWRFRCEFSRTNGFEARELWTVKGLKIPPPEEVTDLTQSFELEGTRLELVALAGPKGKLPEPFRWMWNAEQVRLAVDTSGGMEGKRLTLVEVTDDRGQAVPVEPGESNVVQDHFAYELHPTPTARSLNVTFALHPSRYVEFLAKPTPIRP